MYAVQYSITLTAFAEEGRTIDENGDGIDGIDKKSSMQHLMNRTIAQGMNRHEHQCLGHHRYVFEVGTDRLTPMHILPDRLRNY